MNIALEIEKLAARNGWMNRACVVTPERTWTHRELHDAGCSLAGYLQQLGVGPGDRVVVALADGPLWFSLFLGVARLGGTLLVVNPHLPRAEHQDVVSRMQPKLGVVDDGIAEHFAPMSRLKQADLLDVMMRSAGSEGAALDPFPRAPLYIQFTSGTTGEQKAVPHRHGDFLVYRDSVARAMLQLRQTDVLFSVSKLFFAYGFGNSLAFPFLTGASALLLPHRPSALEVTRAIEQHGVTVLFWVPSGYAAILKSGEGRALERLRLAVSAGETLPTDLGQRLGTLLKGNLLNQLGSTEVGHAYCGTRPGEDPCADVGCALPGYQLEVRDAEGRPVDHGEEGELWVKGPSLPTGYLDAEPSSGSAFLDGWFKSGDRACRLPEGRFRHLGRVDDMLMVGGIKISPVHVESVLGNHPGVVDVAVATEWEQGRSRLVAFVVSERELAETERELREYAKQRLARYMVPQRYVKVRELPRTTSGKLRRHLLRSAHWLTMARVEESPERQRTAKAEVDHA